MTDVKLKKEMSDLCVSCGMCCDGTLFGRVRLYPEDKDIISTDWSPQIDHQKQMMLLPCEYFDGCCSIYQRSRPKECGRYFCYPLRQVRNGELLIDDAKELVGKILKIRQQFVETQQKFLEFSDKSIFEIRRYLENDDLDEETKFAYRKKYGELYMIGAIMFPLLNQLTRKKNINFEADK